jgi:hypothetical protein
MKKIEERKLSMYEVTRDLLAATEAEIIDAMPLMSDYRTNLTNNIISISNYGSSQKLNRKGITDDKGSLRNVAITKASDTARKVQGFAVNTNNLVLLKEVKYTSPQLSKLADNILVIVCNIIYDKAKANLAALVPYGIEDPDLVELRKAIDQYDVSIPKPRTGIVTKKIATLTIKQLFTATDTLLKDQMDVLVGIVKDAYPLFYVNYTNSRKIINPGTHPLAIRCQVVDEENNPIPGVIANVLDSTATYKTKTKGYFYVKTFPEGTYQFTFTKEGYETQPTTVVVNKGERTDLKVTLTAIAQFKKAS